MKSYPDNIAIPIMSLRMDEPASDAASKNLAGERIGSDLSRQVGDPSHDDPEALPAEPLTEDENAGDDREEKPKKKVKFLNLAITSLIVLLTLVVAYRFLAAPKTTTETAPPNTEDRTSSNAIRLSPDQTASIATEVVQKRSVAGELRSPGKVAFNGSKISPVLTQFSGRLVTLSAEVGQNVRAGQVLGYVESPDIVQPQSDYQQALANERTARTSLTNLTRTCERAERLVKVEAIPLRELQQAQVDEKHAREDLERSQQTIAAAVTKLQSLHFSGTEIKSLENSVSPLKRQVPLVAPISGTIIERKAGVGQVIQPGGDPLFQIADLSTVWVNAEVYEDQLSRLRIGLLASVETPAYPSERFAARVDQIGSVVDADKRTVAVRCVLPNSSGKLKPGMFVNVSLGAVSNQDAITVPATAVVTDGEKRVVFVEIEAGRFEKREITVGNEQESTIVVRSGLKEGEQVVIKGGLLIAAESDGAKP